MDENDLWSTGSYCFYQGAVIRYYCKKRRSTWVTQVELLLINPIRT